MKFPYQLPTLFSILILQLSNVLLAQNQFPEPEVLGGIMPERGQVFEQGYGGDYNEEILDIANTTFGLAVCGWEENEAGNKRGVVYEIDSIGVLLNKYTYNQNGHQILNAILPLPDGGYVLAGRSTPSYSTLDNINALDTAWVIRITVQEIFSGKRNTKRLMKQK